MTEAKAKRDWENWNSEKMVEELRREWNEPLSLEERAFLYEVVGPLKPKAETLLDFGCGFGRDVNDFVGQGWRYTGADRTDAMLETARREHPDVEFLKEDLFESKLADNLFDVVVCSDVLVHLPDHRVPMRTLYRIARKFVVVKLCYLTKKTFGLWYAPDRETRDADNSILHFYNPNTFISDLRKDLRPGNVRVDYRRTSSRISPVQAIFTIEKAET